MTRRYSFSIATTLKCSGGCFSFPWIAPLYPWYVPYNDECYARKFWEIKHSGLPLRELWAELLRIMWPLVMWLLKKRVLLLSSPLFGQCLRANYPAWTFSIHQKNVSFNPLPCSTSSSVESLLYLFIVWDLLSCFVFVCNIHV